MKLPIFFEKRELVTPGELIAEGGYVAGESTYKENDKIYATRVGLVNYAGRRLNVVALKAFYVPKVGDLVIGEVVDVNLGSWTLDIKAPHLAILRASDVLDRSFSPQRDDLPSIFDVDDLILSKIVAYDRTRDPLLTIREPGLGKISGGQVVEITPTKIPRVIGSKGSMVNMLKKETGCQITVCQNGLVLIVGKTSEQEKFAIKAIRKIDQEAHTKGLTERVTEMIRKEKKGD